MYNSDPGRLGVFSSTIASLLDTQSSDMHCDLVNAIRDLEKFGCKPALRWEGLPRGEERRRGLNVLSFDLVWISPGPSGTWSQDGKQVCYCLGQGSAENNWYRRALDRFFSGGDKRSLLSFKDVYRMPVHIDVYAMSSSMPVEAKTGGQVPNANISWTGSFCPDPKLDQSRDGSTLRFKQFTDAVSTSMVDEFGTKILSDTRLVWIYQSEGQDDQSDDPPRWAASMFVVLELQRKAEDTPEDYESDFDCLLSNLLNCLQETTRTSLHHGRVKNQIAQTLTHEFKNSIQSISLLSNELLLDARNMQPRSEAIEQLVGKLDTLNWDVATTSSMTQAMYWLAGRNPQGIAFAPDMDATVTRHALYLALHMVARTKRHWKLVDIPALTECEDYFRTYFQIKGRRTPYALFKDLPLVILLFFVFPPVRNIRAHNYLREAPDIEISVTSHANVLRIHQVSIETSACSETYLSRSIAELMRMVQESFHDTIGSIIEVDPCVYSSSTARADGNFRVERTTALSAYRVPARPDGTQ